MRESDWSSDVCSSDLVFADYAQADMDQGKVFLKGNLAIYQGDGRTRTNSLVRADSAEFDITEKSKRIIDWIYQRQIHPSETQPLCNYLNDKAQWDHICLLYTSRCV